MTTSVTRMPYCMCYVRHIDGIQYHLNDDLAPKYVDVVEHNNIRTIDRAKNRRLREMKVGGGGGGAIFVDDNRFYSQQSAPD